MPDEQTFEVNIRTTADTAGAAQAAESLAGITAKTEEATEATAGFVDVQKEAAEASAALAAAQDRENSIFQQKIILAANQQNAIDLRGAGKEEEAKAIEAIAAEQALALEIQKKSTVTEAEALALAKERLATRQNETLQMEAQNALNAELIAAETERQILEDEAQDALNKQLIEKEATQQAAEKAAHNQRMKNIREEAAAKEAAIAEEDALADKVMRSAGRAAGLGRNTGVAAAAGGDVLLTVIALKEAWELVHHFINASREATEAFKKASHEAYAEAEKDARSLAEAQKKGMQQAKDEAEAYIKSLHEITQVSLQMQNRLADSDLKKKLSDIDLQEEKDLREIVVDEGDTSKQGAAVIRAEAENKRAAAKQKAEQDRAQQEFSQADFNLSVTQKSEAKLTKEATHATLDSAGKSLVAENLKALAENATAARKKAEEELKEAHKKVKDSYWAVNPLDPKAADTAGLMKEEYKAQQKFDATKGEEEGANSDYKVANAQATLAASRAAELQGALEKVTKEVEDFKDSVKVAKANLDAIPAKGAKELEKVDKEGQEKISKAIKEDAEALQKAADNITNANKKADELLDKKDAREATAEEKWKKEREKANGTPGMHHGAGSPAHHEGHGATDANGAPAGRAKHGSDVPFDFNAAFHKHVGDGPTEDFNAAFGPNADNHQIDTRRSDVRQSAGREQNFKVDLAIGRANEALKGAASAPHTAELDRVIDVVHKLADEVVSLKGQNKNDESHKPIASKISDLERKVDLLITQTNKARGG